MRPVSSPAPTIRNLRPKSRSSVARSGERWRAAAAPASRGAPPRRRRRRASRRCRARTRSSPRAQRLRLEHDLAAHDLELARAVHREQPIGEAEEPQVLGLPRERRVAGARRDAARREAPFAAADLELVHAERVGIDRRREPAVHEPHAVARDPEREPASSIRPVTRGERGVPSTASVALTAPSTIACRSSSAPSGRSEAIAAMRAPRAAHPPRACPARRRARGRARRSRSPCRAGWRRARRCRSSRRRRAARRARGA